ncbi:MAG: 2-oxoacid:acceptor oxidoreductase subunit alpha [Spirochaetae bacterium HGW-Spirochaetae-5]|nr:MAG: 2-oxoacid:acceptor oxidoreductase subunit alpha [Spirochaetae bacterium HGW-Spirochaetae-5]
MANNITDDLVIVLAGQAGQGIQVIENILSSLLKGTGYNFFSTSELMSRVRGGLNSTELRVSSKRSPGFLDRIDLLIPLHNDAIAHLKKRISLGEKDKVNYEGIIDIQFTGIANELGNAVFSNTVAAGLICGLLKIDERELENFIFKYFAVKNEDIRNKNLQAIKKGYFAGQALTEINISINKSIEVKTDLLLSGADAISLGAVAGGCNYVCGYPMSPSTSVLEKMSSYAEKFDIIAEQVEDEIGVVNMALGAWYAGARAMVTTSGGGFALMSEGLSLCGMIESPLIIHLAQRPGPATGLPTRTEQGDLNLALYAGHGDFPRIILAPGTLEEGFRLTQRAFNLSDKYQVPVLILTDQYYVDSIYNTPVFKTDDIRIEKYIVETDKNYKRFSLTENGISPRGIPGFGNGNVCVDSDEHDESGHITEDSDMRIKMADKRFKKFESIKKDISPATLTGSDNYTTLVICWGSTFNIVNEAVEGLGSKDIAVMHFSWIFPLQENIIEYLNKASNVIIVENNSSAQFAMLIKQTTGYSIDKKILKYNGLPFSVEEVMKEIQKFI